MPIYVAYIIGVIVAIICTVLMCILVMPEKKRDTLNGFFRFLHDIFNFKFLIIEKILKVLYMLSTFSCISIGFFMLFSGYSTYSYFGISGGFQSFAGYGLLLMIVGPIAIRITYEFLMMAILAVNSVLKINAKLKDQNEDDSTEKPDTNVDFAVFDSHKVNEIAPDYKFCTQCGTKYDTSKGGCPNCSDKENKL